MGSLFHSSNIDEGIELDDTPYFAEDLGPKKRKVGKIIFLYIPIIKGPSIIHFLK
jgi:hypothetical protein